METSWHGLRSAAKGISQPEGSMSEEPVSRSSSSPSEKGGREHARRAAMQGDLLRRAYRRSVHRTYIEAALRRAGHAVLPRESVNAFSLRRRSID
jgi:hypothetical protein